MNQSGRQIHIGFSEPGNQLSGHRNTGGFHRFRRFEFGRSGRQFHILVSEPGNQLFGPPNKGRFLSGFLANPQTRPVNRKTVNLAVKLILFLLGMNLIDLVDKFILVFPSPEGSFSGTQIQECSIAFVGMNLIILAGEFIFFFPNQGTRFSI
jgi:hypothetical protein